MKKRLITAILLEMFIIVGFGLICFGISRINFDFGIIAAGASILTMIMFEILSSKKK